MSTRLRIASLIFMMINAVVFGAGLVTVLLVPALSAAAFGWIPTVVIASFAISAPLAWLIAPRLQMRYWRAREQEAIATHGQ
jgi:hypothetical protein